MLATGFGVKPSPLDLAQSAVIGAGERDPVRLRSDRAPPLTPHDPLRRSP